MNKDKAKLIAKVKSLKRDETLCSCGAIIKIYPGRLFINRLMICKKCRKVGGIEALGKKNQMLNY